MPYKNGDTGKEKAWRGAVPSIKYLKKFPDSFFKNAVILDLGLNVGHLSRYMLSERNGVKLVIGYEPNPKAFLRVKILREDFPGRFIAKRAAVLATKRDGDMYLTTSKGDDELGYYNNGIMKPNPRINGVSYKVKVLSFAKQLKRYKPNGIKMDIEGSEYDLIFNVKIPSYVKWLSMEVHGLKGLGAYLLPYLIERLALYGLYPACELPRLRIIDEKHTNSFYGSEVMNFSREKLYEVTVKEKKMLKKLKILGSRVYKSGYRPIDIVKLKLFTKLCGKIK